MTVATNGVTDVLTDGAKEAGNTDVVFASMIAPHMCAIMKAGESAGSYPNVVQIGMIMEQVDIAIASENMAVVVVDVLTDL